MTTIIWREWYNEPAVKRMAEMGTLPREETEIDDRFNETGSDIARLIAQDATSHGSELFQEGTRIVIVEPERYAGTYDVGVDYEPTFYVTKYEGICRKARVPGVD
jgi:hypothetical protein